ncbi:hypothetical protein LTR36_004856 [Oleoguttula mirabilis]|uniref:Uncharacterized protein n=1 Tax=Oleoguttula mirabilis TaxID=1507867 RepID=A0AAV9JFY8_9PEZI|nr:hypothetical protein LTR36_004856 [Oleoguttula mirabilis]
MSPLDIAASSHVNFETATSVKGRNKTAEKLNDTGRTSEDVDEVADNTYGSSELCESNSEFERGDVHGTLNITGGTIAPDLESCATSAAIQDKAKDATQVVGQAVVGEKTAEDEALEMSVMEQGMKADRWAAIRECAELLKLVRNIRQREKEYMRPLSSLYGFTVSNIGTTTSGSEIIGLYATIKNHVETIADLEGELAGEREKSNSMQEALINSAKKIAMLEEALEDSQNTTAQADAPVNNEQATASSNVTDVPTATVAATGAAYGSTEASTLQSRGSGNAGRSLGVRGSLGGGLRGGSVGGAVVSGAKQGGAEKKVEGRGGRRGRRGGFTGRGGRGATPQ